MLNYQRVIQIINPSKPAAAKAPLFQLRQVRPRRRDARHLALLAHSVTHRWQGRQGRLLDEMFGKAIFFWGGWYGFKQHDWIIIKKTLRLC